LTCRTDEKKERLLNNFLALIWCKEPTEAVRELRQQGVGERV